MDESMMTMSKAWKDHVSSHVKYPATKAQILQSCMAGEFPDEVRKMAEMHLQDKTYASAEEALRDMHMA
jgi:hypothetical protein